MTARETTLGALTAADLGKRVRIESAPPDFRDGALVRIDHAWWWRDEAETFVGFSDDSERPPLLQHKGIRLPSTTPVTVYDEEEA
jgi:hypothetical protein